MPGSSLAKPGVSHKTAQPACPTSKPGLASELLVGVSNKTARSCNHDEFRLVTIQDPHRGQARPPSDTASPTAHTSAHRPLDGLLVTARRPGPSRGTDTRAGVSGYPVCRVSLLSPATPPQPSPPVASPSLVSPRASLWAGPRSVSTAAGRRAPAISHPASPGTGTARKGICGPANWQLAINAKGNSGWT